MGGHSNYSDEKMTGAVADDVLRNPEFRLALYDARRCDGDGRAGAGEGPSLSSLIERSTGGDWSWQPQLYKQDPGVFLQDGHVVDRTASLEELMPTLKGSSFGMPERLGRAREAAGEGGAVRYGNEVTPLRRYTKLISGVNGGMFDTLAGAHTHA